MGVENLGKLFGNFNPIFTQMNLKHIFIKYLCKDIHGSFFFFFQLYLWHVEIIPGPGIDQVPVAAVTMPGS